MGVITKAPEGSEGMNSPIQQQPKKPTLMSWLVAKYATYHAEEPHLGPSLERLLRSR